MPYDYDGYNYNAAENTARALFNIAEAIEKLADNIGKQGQGSQTVLIKELTNISNKTDQLYQIVETSIAKQESQAFF